MASHAKVLKLFVRMSRQMGELSPFDRDPLRDRGPLPLSPEGLQRLPHVELVNLVRVLLERVERLEKDMRLVKEKLGIK